VLLHGGADPKELAHFIEGSTEARSRGHASKPTHRVVTLFDATVILLQSIVQIAVGPVEHLTAQSLANRTGIGMMSICRHPLWSVAYNLDGLRRSKRLAASMSRFSLNIESTKLPSRSMAR
jgi:hypothetical protein